MPRRPVPRPRAVTPPRIPSGHQMMRGQSPRGSMPWTSAAGTSAPFAGGSWRARLSTTRSPAPSAPLARGRRRSS
eukprot:3031595-Alexandrium_andersonii.AAC.1